MSNYISKNEVRKRTAKDKNIIYHEEHEDREGEIKKKGN